MFTLSDDSYVACLCEGQAEMTILDILLDKSALVFSRQQLLDRKVLSPPYYRDSSKFTNQYLTMNYGGRQICVFSIQDRKVSSCKIKPPYLDKISGPYYVITAPEIEMLMIHSLSLFEEYKKTQQGRKPSIFLAEHLKEKSSKIKSRPFIEAFYLQHDLVAAIKEHKRQAGQLKHKQLFLADILI